MSGERERALLGNGGQGAAAGVEEGQRVILDIEAQGPVRYVDAVGAPWERADYNELDRAQWLTSEAQQAKELFDNPLTPDTPIRKSIAVGQGASLTFSNVSFSITKPDRSRATILEPCHGHFEPGQLVALMGPSGCGKSTLLDMLANKKTAPYAGEILVNGHPRGRLFPRIAAYVPQEDVMPQHWRVREAVEFNQRLKVPRLRNVPAGFRKETVDVLLAAFGLTDVADTKIGGDKVRGCSGGQRRRVTLARGVAQRPSLLFADEPTSGLSATDAELCVKALRIIAKKFNILILVVIHQPRVEVARMFDQLVLLTARPGRMVYSGSMCGAFDYWRVCGHPVPPHANPTDHYLDLVTPGSHTDRADKFVADFQQRQLDGILAEVDQKKAERGPTQSDLLTEQHQMWERAGMGPPRVREEAIALPFWQQVATLLERKTRLTLRNPSAISMPVLVPLTVGLLLGVMYTNIGSEKTPFQQRLPFVFTILVRMCMSGMQQMPQLMEDRTVMKYEISEGLYGVSAFTTVGLSVDISLSLLGVVLNCVVMYAFSGMHWQYFPMILSWAVLNFLVFDAFFACLAAFARDLQTAQVCAIPFQTIFMMFSGFLISKRSAPSYLQWLFEVSPIGYALQSIVCRMAEDEKDGPAVVRLYGFKEGQEQKGTIVILVMMAVFRILQVVSLRYLNNIQK